MGYDFVTFTVEDHVGIVTFCRPPVNAFNGQAKTELAEVFESIQDRNDIYVVVLRAEGRGFSAGNDLDEVRAAKDPKIGESLRVTADRVTNAVFNCKVPVVAAIQGFVAGLGIALISGCDLIIAADDATILVPEIKSGTLASPFFLRALLPDKIARYYLYTGEAIPVAVMEKYGAIFQVTTRDGLKDAAMAVASRIAESYPRSLQLYKSIISEGDRKVQDIVAISSWVRKCASVLENDPNREEMLQARREKRKPVYRFDDPQGEA